MFAFFKKNQTKAQILLSEAVRSFNADLNRQIVNSQASSLRHAVEEIKLLLENSHLTKETKEKFMVASFCCYDSFINDEVSYKTANADILQVRRAVQSAIAYL